MVASLGEQQLSIKTCRRPEEEWTPLGYSCSRYTTAMVPQRPNQVMEPVKIKSKMVLIYRSAFKIPTSKESYDISSVFLTGLKEIFYELVQLGETAKERCYVE